MQAASMQDWFEIHNLFIKYATTLDHGDVEGCLSCFLPDGVVESPILGSFVGTVGIREFIERTANTSRERNARFRHVVTNLVAEVEGDRARANCYLLDFYTHNGETQLLAPGEYTCDLKRVDGRWLFQRRVVDMDKHFDLKM